MNTDSLLKSSVLPSLCEAIRISLRAMFGVPWRTLPSNQAEKLNDGNERSEEELFNHPSKRLIKLKLGGIQHEL